MKPFSLFCCAALAACLVGVSGCKSRPANGTSGTVVLIKTSLGDIKVQLDPEKAPATVANFLSYVDKSFYDDTIFHRVIPGFMIQGGGLTRDMVEKPTGNPVQNESSNGLANDRGTIAMARRPDPNSATAQFFINTVNNPGLNYPNGGGYTVFGKVIEGMDTVDRIKNVPTGNAPNGMQNVPQTPVVIQSIRRAP
jgi:peptidyl-prolyl cis-trans isomerase A (cyclophilin A)